MAIALIPARGGSKRIPRKNIKEFCGKPIIAYSIETALKSKLFDRVIVSTDDEEIAEVAKQFGAEVPFLRPPELSNDFATTNDVIEHTIQALELSENDEVCCLYATAPMLTVESLAAGYEALTKEDFAFAFTATEFPFPIQRAFTFNDRVSMVYPEHFKTRSQDLPTTYHDAGQCYWGKVWAFTQNLPIFAEHSKPIMLDRLKVQDIDTPQDWLIAEQLFLLSKQLT